MPTRTGSGKSAYALTTRRRSVSSDLFCAKLAGLLAGVDSERSQVFAVVRVVELGS